MTDLEMTELCAAAMGYSVAGKHWGGLPLMTKEEGIYAPLTDDAQAMALVKKLDLSLTACGWSSTGPDKGYYQVRSVGNEITTTDNNLNRAIVECVAELTHPTESGERERE